MNAAKKDVLTIYIGWDSREPIAADVCRHSILEHASIPVNIVYLKQDDLRAQGIYQRPVDDLGSTEFTFTRFLVPYLNNYEGWAIFVDCDFVFVEDVAELLALADRTKAVQVVQHDYTPPEGVKMDGKQQHPYPRKNWSSMILWNCAHKDNKKVTLDFANTATGQELHRFTWLRDKDIGNLAPEWNWLVGWYREVRDGYPKAIHYTLGGPWFDNYRDCEYADVWNRYRDSFEAGKFNQTIKISDLTLPAHYQDLLSQVLETQRDPTGRYYKHNIDDLVGRLNYIRKPVCFGLMDAEDTITQGQEMSTDHIVENFVTGATGTIGSWAERDRLPPDVPFVVRGIAKRKVMHWCKDNNRTFYYIDTGYFGNGKHKTYHRITKNALQYDQRLDPNCPDDRFLRTGVSLNKFRGGRNVLVCPPSQKALLYWGVDLQQWLDETVAEIKKYTDRPVVIREKQGRSTRVNEDTMEMALSRDVHCMVTFNSIAAVEALILGKPVFTMGPNAAEPLANRDLSKIEKPFIPSVDAVRNLCCNLAYAQFTTAEMMDGTAWRIVNGL